MSSTTLYRLSGISLVLGSFILALGAIMRVLGGDDPTSSLLAWGWFLGAPGAILVALGLPGIYLRQARSAGSLGLLGVIGLIAFVLIFGVFGGLLHGLVLPTLPLDIAKNSPPSVGLVFMTGALLGMAGGILLGIATVRAGMLPRAAGAVVSLGALVMLGHGMPLHMEDVGLLLLVTGLAWLGLSTATMREPQAVAPGETAGLPVRVQA